MPKAPKASVLGGYPLAFALAMIAALLQQALGPLAASSQLASLSATSLATYLVGAGPGLATAILCPLFALAPHSYSALAHSEFARREFAREGGVFVLYAFASALMIFLIQSLRSQVAALRKEEAKAQAQVAQQHIFFRDLQHRVANSLQIAASILTMHKRRIKGDAASASALDDARDRLSNMALIHRRLYQPGENSAEPAQATLRGHLEDLCLDLIKASTAQKIAFRIDGDMKLADYRKLASLSLIVAEIVTNALKHGFDERDHGEISIRLEQDQNDLVLTATDNGWGLPENFDPRGATGRGVQIMAALAQQLAGELEFAREPTTTVRLRIPL